MKRVTVLICLALAFTAARAQQIKGEDLAEFRTVSLVGDMNVELIPGDKSGISMELNGIDASQVTWGVNAGKLSVKVRPVSQKQGSLAVKIYYRLLENLTSNGADVLAKDTLRADVFTADISAGAKFTAVVECLDFELHATGNSAAQLTGVAKYCTIEADQRSKIDARGLDSVSATAKAYIGSEVYILGQERIVAVASTAGSVFYKGSPAVLRTSTKLGGNVNNIGR